MHKQELNIVSPKKKSIYLTGGSDEITEERKRCLVKENKLGNLRITQH